MKLVSLCLMTFFIHLLISCSHVNRGVELRFQHLELSVGPLDSALVDAYENRSLQTLEVVGIPKTESDPYDLQGLLFFAYEYPLPVAKKRYQPLTLGLEVSERRIFSQKFFHEASFEHPRQATFADLDHDGRIDLIVSDHGHDEEPFAGAYTQFFFQNEEHLFEKTPYQTRLGYWFSSCTLGVDKERTLILVVSTGTESGDFPTGPKLIEVNSSRKFIVHGLPPSITDTRLRKYLTCAFRPQAPFEVYLGMMDGEVKSRAPRDYRFALKVSQQDFNFESKPLPMPPKSGESDRGTIELKAIDIDGDGLIDLASNSHDHQFSAGLVEFFMGVPGGGFKPWRVFNPSDSAVSVAKDYFIPRAHLADFDQNGRLDLVFYTGQSGSDFDPKAKSSVHLYLQQENGQFIDVSNQIPNNKDLQGLTPVRLKSGAMGLLYIYGPRQYELYQLSSELSSKDSWQ